MLFSLEFILWLFLVFGGGGTFVFYFLRLPHRIVRFQGKFYKKQYKDRLHLSDQEIDNIYQLPTDRFFMGPRSEFIKNAPDTPEKYTRLIRAYRIIGCLGVAMLVLAFSLLLLGIWSGAWTS